MYLIQNIVRAAIRFGPSSFPSGRMHPSWLTNHPIKPRPAGNQQPGQFSHSNTNTFRGRYSTILAPCDIDSAATATTTATATAAATAPEYVARLIYAAEQEGILTEFLQCHQGAMGRGAYIALIH